MASLIPGYEYDIFISYRQKDNKGDKWVSEFVEALKTELESTFKEEISLYFDVNPHDGLLETYDVDASLKEKLKCLVFIPIISRTYCDPNSFAWEHEFKPFVEYANKDRFGLKINLPNGNVTTRVIPVRIHDLDTADIRLCESLLGGVLRGVEFVYRSSGVNRPLMANEAHPNDNLNKTYYRDQINKLANAIDEIVHSTKNRDQAPGEKSSSVQSKINFESRIINPVRGKIFINNKIRAGLILFTLFLCVAGILFLRSYYLKANEKTIAIIPLTNPLDDKNLAECAIWSTDAIITKLQEIKSLTVRANLSSLQYLNTRKAPAELRKELKANYIVVIKISKTGKDLSMWIGLTKTGNNKELWAHLFPLNVEQLMPQFTQVVQTLAGNLNIKLTGQEVINIEKDLTVNPQAYLNYLYASAKLFAAMGNKLLDSTKFSEVINLYDKAIESDPGFANAYARRAIARSWGYHNQELNSTHIDKCLSDILSASKINQELTDVQIAQGFYYYYCKKDYSKALINFHTAYEKDPQNYQPLFFMAMVYRAMEDWEKAHIIINKVIMLNPQEPLYLTNIGITFDFLHKFDSALIFHQKAIEVNPLWTNAYLNKIGSLLLKYGRTNEVRPLLDSAIRITHEKLTDYKIMFDTYEGKYPEGFTEAIKSSPEDFYSKGDRFLSLATLCSLMNRTGEAGIYYDSAIVALNTDLANKSNDALLHSSLGIAYAGKGIKDKAIAEGQKAVDITVEDKNTIVESDMRVSLAQIFTVLGLYDEAINKIEDLLKYPSNFSPKALRLDPVWKPLLNNPEFKKMIKKYS